MSDFPIICESCWSPTFEAFVDEGENVVCETCYAEGGDHGCEVYVLNDGTLQCGNCGGVFLEYGPECPKCGAKVVSVVEEGEADDSTRAYDLW